MSSHSEIKSALVKVYEKLSKAITKDIGYEQYKIIVQTYITSEKQMNYIMQQVSDYISGLSLKDKDIGLRLLPLIFCTTINSADCYRVLSPILSIIQFNITDSNITIIPIIANCFGKIVQCSMQNDIEIEEIDKYEQKIYEILQGFCIYNMKQNEKANKLCGSTCLTRLVENCPFVLQPNYMRFIWENILYFIDKKNFQAKYELLNCLISIILGAESSFCSYANVTLYKVMDFLTDSDWIKRKLALNVVYTLILYCKEEVMPLREQIIEFLKGLKSDKVKEVREVCLLILHKFNEEEAQSQNSTNAEREREIKHNSKHQIRLKSKEMRNERESSIKTEETQMIKVNKSTNNNNGIKKKKRDGTINRVLCNSSSNFDINNTKELNYLGDKKPLTPTRHHKKQINLNKTQDDEVTERKNRDIVNRKDNVFVNEKMVIKRNPNYSIFKAGPNQDFFKQSNNRPDVIVLENKTLHRGLSSQSHAIQEEIKNGDNNKRDKEVSIMNLDESNLSYSKIQSKTIEVIDNKIKEEENNKDEDNNETNEKSILVNKTQYRNKETTKNRMQNSFDKDPEQISFKSNIINSNTPISNSSTNIHIKKKKIAKKDKDRVKADFNDKKQDYIDIENESIKYTFPNSNYNMPLKMSKLQEISLTESKNNSIETSIDNSKESSSKQNREKQFQYYPKNTYVTNENISSHQEQHKEEISALPLQQSAKKEDNNINSFNSKLLTELLEQMKNLSEKQVSLIDALSEMQDTTTNKIDSLTDKMAQLELTMSSLSNQMMSLKSSRQQTNRDSNLNCTLSSIHTNKKSDNWEDIRSNLNCFNIDQAFNLALSNDADLVKLTTQITISQLRETSSSLINDSILRLISLLTKGSNITIILTYFKNILMRVKCDLKKITIDNIKDILSYIANNSVNYSHITDENIVDINLILSYLKTLDR